jgi:hypothetical protein
MLKRSLLERGLRSARCRPCRIPVERGGFWQWSEAGFGALDPRVVMRDTIPRPR